MILRGNNSPPINGRLYIINFIVININIAHPSHRRVRCHVGPRGAATWPGVPRRIHVGPAQKTPFLPLLNYFFTFKNCKINQKNPEKIPKNRKFINFNI